MAIRVDQGAIVMLSVDLDQSLAHLAQELHAHGRVVDEGAASAVGSLHPPQDQIRFGLDAVGGQQRAYGVVPVQVENGRHLTLACTAPHQRGIASASKRKRKGVEQNRFSCAGFPGEHGQALAEFEIEFVDQDDVADRQGG